MEKPKILLVDDSQTMILFEKLVLGGGYEIITAENGQKGLEAVIEERPDLVLLDLMMPVMDGMAALKAIRVTNEGQNIPIIMVTTKSEEERVEACYKLGCTDYITKPIKQVELILKVRKYLAGAG
ncbi:MAG TPA: response regulator [Nitrospiria bacterium]|nr:response regulator [Nitrospiria bacterium]